MDKKATGDYELPGDVLIILGYVLRIVTQLFSIKC